MKETMCTHLAKRGSRYYFRRKIPLDLLPQYTGRKEVMRSLHTSDRREAERLARIVGVELDREFELLRVNNSAASIQQSNNSELDTSASDVIGDSDLEPAFLCEDVVQKYSEASPTPISYYSKLALRQWRDQAVVSGTLKDFIFRCEREKDFHQAVLRGDEASVWKISHHEGVRNGLQAFLTGEGNMGITAAWAARYAKHDHSEVAATRKDRTSFDVLIGKWVAGVRPEENTIKRTRMHVRRFEQSTSIHNVEEVTRQHAIRFIDQLQKLNQTPQNINMHLASIIKLLNYAVRLDLIKQNDASGLTLRTDSGEKARRSFDLLALKSIFSSPVYAAGYRPKGGGGDASYWLPLLALFTGARLEELCQLHPDDVMQATYHDHNDEALIWIIQITDEGEGQGLKNAGSRRRVPLHPELEQLGFVKFVQQAKTEGRKRIFHKLVPSIDGKEGGNFTKWFGRYLRDTCKVTDRRMVFHSFRHLFKEVLREIEIPKEINDALTGHESGDVGDKYGGDTYPLRPLVNAIRKFKINNFILPQPYYLPSIEKQNHEGEVCVEVGV